MSQRTARPALLRSKSPRRPASARPLLEALEDRLVPATYTVNSTADLGTGSGLKGDLRYCLTRADAHPDSTIQFDGTVFAAPQTIVLHGTELPVITTNMTIRGPAAGVTVSGNHKSRVFEIGDGTPNPNVTLSGLTITQGNVGPSNGGGIEDSSSGLLTLTNCTLRGNSANHGGGLDLAGATAALTNCTLSGNSTAGGGGGLYQSGGSAALTNCTLSGNTAYRGGALDSGGDGPAITTVLTACTLSGNTAAIVGGGIYHEAGLAVLTNCTLSGNQARGDFKNSSHQGGGGGIFNEMGSIALMNCTLSGNSAVYNAGGIFNQEGFTLLNTLVAGNAGGDVFDLSAGINSTVSNCLIGNGYGSRANNGTNGNLVGTFDSPLNPLLAPLGNYGGPTQTMPLLPGSPALNAGTAAGAPTRDERGLPRVGAVDIGAFESQGFTLSVQTGNNQQALPDTALPVPFAVRVTARDPLEPVQGGLVTFTAPSGGPGGTFGFLSLHATAAVSAAGVATAPPFFTNGTVGAFSVSAAAKGGNAAIFHEQVVAAAVVHGNLVVEGTDGNDTIAVIDTGTQFQVHVNGVLYPFAASLVTGRVIVSGYAGNDTITLRGKFPAEIHAGAGKDVIHGGDGGNVIYGGSGTLTAYAGGGDDVLVGGSGKATLYGGKGKAVLIGGSLRVGLGFDTYDALAALAAQWATGDTSQAAALRAAIIAGASDTLHAGTGGTWGFAAAAGDFVGFRAGRDKQTQLT